MERYYIYYLVKYKGKMYLLRPTEIGVSSMINLTMLVMFILLSVSHSVSVSVISSSLATHESQLVFVFPRRRVDRELNSKHTGKCYTKKTYHLYNLISIS